MLAHVPFALCMTPAPIIYVAGDGSGDFNCDGADDQIEINQALQYIADNPEYTTVHLKGPFTYVTNDTILISSYTTLEGDSSATIKLASNAGWPSGKPLIKERDSFNTDITIRGFKIDGNREGNTNVNSGAGYYNLINMSNCQNIDLHDMYLTNNHGDGLKTNNCSNIKFYKNKIYLLGHDGLYAIKSSGVEAYNNDITCRTNSGLRLYNTNKASFHDNVITSEGSGGAGIEIQKQGTALMDDIEVYNNVIYKTALAGIWMFGSDTYSTSSANVHVYHNQIYDTGTSPSTKVVGGVLSNGFNALIENNVIDGAYGAGVVQNNVYTPIPTASGFVIIVRNNIITNTRNSIAGGNGYGIYNSITNTNSFVLENNCIYNNAGGAYLGAQASPQDIALDPQYADRDNHDYHLKSKAGRWNGIEWVNDSMSSPCIDAGSALSDYSREPEPNGDRINIGPDGNTIYASKSELNVPSPILPTADFSTSITGGYAPLSVQFADLSQNAVSRNWNFGDGAVSTELNPAHIYSSAGSYFVTLVVSNTNGTNSKSITVTVSEKPVLPIANFNTNTLSGYAPLSVQFTDLSQNAISWSWDFGDGVTSALPNPVHTYSSAGSYTVTLTASNANGANSMSAKITVVQRPILPVADFSTSATSGYAPLSVQFTDLSQNAISRSWDFNNDGIVDSSISNPVYTYTAPGSYTANLRVSNAYGTNSKTITINVLKPIPPVASFSSPVTSGSMPLNILFSDTSTGIPSSWNWNFGDGTANSTQQNPTHTYSKAGSYTVTLTVRNSAGSNTVRRMNYITAATLRRPVAAISASVTSGTLPLTVSFIDKSTGGSPVSWTWSFGDGTSSTERNPVHTYNKTGRYTVRLTVANAAGSSTVTRTNYITVNALRRPVAAFSASATSGYVPFSVAFTDRSTGLIASRSWSFGDGTSSIEQNPVHIYNKTGRYTVRLTVTNAAGSNTATRSNYITVNTLKPPVAAFSVSLTSGKAPFRVTFTDRSTNTPTSWAWSFGDGTSSTEKNPVHIYSKAGRYTINLTATNSAGSNTLRRTNYITVR